MPAASFSVLIVKVRAPSATEPIASTRIQDQIDDDLLQLNTIAPNGIQVGRETCANRDCVLLDRGPHHFSHLLNCFIEVEMAIPRWCFFDMIADAVDDSFAAVGIPDDTSERVPDLGHIWRIHVQKARGRTSVVTRSGDRMQNFVSQRGGQFAHYA